MQDKEKIIISHYSEEIGDMVDVTLYWRSLALTYAKDKKWVSITVLPIYCKKELPININL